LQHIDPRVVREPFIHHDLQPADFGVAEHLDLHASS